MMSSHEENHHGNPLNLPLPANHKASYQVSKAQAQSWLDANGSKKPAFEISLRGGTLSTASEFATSLYQDDDNSIGSIRFQRPIEATDTADTLQKAVDFCCPNSISLPGLEHNTDWEVTARFPCSQVTPNDDKNKGENEQTVTIDKWDGTTLAWTIHNARFFAIGGECKVTSEAMTNLADYPRPEGSYWQIRQHFQGTIHYECKVNSSGIVSVK